VDATAGIEEEEEKVEEALLLLLPTVNAGV